MMAVQFASGKSRIQTHIGMIPNPALTILLSWLPINIRCVLINTKQQVSAIPASPSIFQAHFYMLSHTLLHVILTTSDKRSVSLFADENLVNNLI